MTTKENSWEGKMKLNKNIRKNPKKFHRNFLVCRNIDSEIYKYFNMIEKIVQDMTEGNLTPLEAVELINSTIGGITRVDYKEGLKFSISNHRNKESVKRNGLNREQSRNLRELAAIAYLRAQQNGHHQNPGEIHIDKGLSSKHYPDSFKEYAGGLVAKYAVA